MAFLMEVNMQPKSELGPIATELLAEARRMQRIQCNFGQVSDRACFYKAHTKKQGASKNKREKARNQWNQENMGTIDANRVTKAKGKKSRRSPWDAQDPMLGYPKLWGKKLADASPAYLSQLVRYNRKLAHPKHVAVVEFVADHGVTGRALQDELEKRNVDIENHRTVGEKGKREVHRAQKRKLLKLK